MAILDTYYVGALSLVRHLFAPDPEVLQSRAYETVTDFDPARR